MANAAIAELRQSYPQEWSQAVAEMERRRRDGSPIRNINVYAMPRFRELVEERRQREVNEAARASMQSDIDNCPDCSRGGWIVRDREPGQSSVAERCNHRRDAPDVVVEPFSYLLQDVEIASNGTQQREVAS
jgi:hypothetical protein